MLALCLMPLVTHYAQNYADIISWSLAEAKRKMNVTIAKHENGGKKSLCLKVTQNHGKPMLQT